MTVPRTPCLGILIGDAPSAQMVVVAFLSSNRNLKWAYAGMGHPMRPHAYDMVDPDNFTPLSDFGVNATLTTEGLLAVHQLNLISIARYHDGKPRHWQGAAATTLHMNPKFGGYVAEAIRLDFEARREQRALSETAQVQSTNTALA